MAKMCTVSRLERQFATLYLFHAPTWGGVLGWGLVARIAQLISMFRGYLNPQKIENIPSPDSPNPLN